MFQNIGTTSNQMGIHHLISVILEFLNWKKFDNLIWISILCIFYHYSFLFETFIMTLLRSRSEQISIAQSPSVMAVMWKHVSVDSVQFCIAFPASWHSVSAISACLCTFVECVWCDCVHVLLTIYTVLFISLSLPTVKQFTVLFVTSSLCLSCLNLSVQLSNRLYF